MTVSLPVYREESFSFAISFTALAYLWWPALSLFSVALIAYAMGIPVVRSARGSSASAPHRESQELGGDS